MGQTQQDCKLSRTFASTETLRLAEIHTLDVFYTPIEERFERITRLARRTLRVPVAAVTLINSDKQWFKSVAGWSVSELPLEQSLCASTMRGHETIVVEDTHASEDLSDHPLVKERPRFRFYAGRTLTDKYSGPVGTFCVMDLKPREFSAEDKQTFDDLAMLAQRELLSDQLTNAQAQLASKLGAARREAMIDPLTRLWNRRGATVMLRAALEQADAYGTDLALGLLDIDRFKQINDLHGHQIGDEALCKVARALTGSVRSEDIICRPGGDEFLLIMTETNRELASQLVDRVRRQVSTTFIRTREGPVPVTLSAGCAVRQHGDKVTDDELFELADKALMQSKADGRNRLRMAS